jgi:hypothetical protein
VAECPSCENEWVMDHSEACPHCGIHRMACLAAAERIFGKMRKRFGEAWWEQ